MTDPHIEARNIEEPLHVLHFLSALIPTGVIVILTGWFGIWKAAGQSSETILFKVSFQENARV